MKKRAPRVKPGDRITAVRWNELADVVDGPTNAPKDLESDGSLQAADVDAPADLTLVEQSRSTTTVRVENPSDSSQFVDVERVTLSTLKGSNGERWEIDWRD